MRIVVAGAGLMGSQIGAEYALGGHDVLFVARRREAAQERVERAFGLAAEDGLYLVDDIDAARRRVAVETDLATAGAGIELLVESVVEDMDAKTAVLRRAVALFPDAILASNTSSLSITALGEAAGAPERIVGIHYWNPPLLMPLVEVIRGAATPDRVVSTVTAALRNLGKRPVVVDKDVPGFVWNRLQFALLREAVWIVEQGVAAPDTVDEIVRDGLARRWRFTGPFATAALGGADTFARIAANLFPVLSDAERIDDLRRWLDHPPEFLAGIAQRRDAGLVEDLKRDRYADAAE